MSLSVPKTWEQYRVVRGELASRPGWNCGFFFVKTPALYVGLKDSA